jgi:hypothetical protein
VKKYNEVPAGFHDKNDKRLELIKKKYSSGLTRAEETELKKLEAEVAQMLDAQNPEIWQYNQSA